MAKETKANVPASTTVKVVTQTQVIQGKNSSNLPTFQAPLPAPPPPAKKK
jgi:hypothetical protein